MLRRFLYFLAMLVTPALLSAQGITPELVAEGPVAPGGEVELAIHMRPAPGWHGYWQNPGDAGVPMDVQWQLPRGFSAGPLRYPVPMRLSIANLMNYVYERDFAVLARLKAPANAQGVVPVRAHARWLACTDRICVPEEGDLTLDVLVGRGTPNRAQFDEWRRELPQPLATTAQYIWQAGVLNIALPLPADVEVRVPYVFPITDNVVDYAGQQSFRRTGNTLVAELPTSGAPTDHFDGVVAIGPDRGLQFHAVAGAVPDGGTPVGAQSNLALMWAVLGALVGGILLNLMPCVFPILALKALHLSRAGEGDHARSDAFGYTAGAVAGTGALGILLLAIRAAGSEVGWAFQLQDPRTILILLLLGVAITANLLGLFELPAIGGHARPVGSFGTGALAAFVATPCAGPFLGAALGTALLLPAAGSIAVFAALGLGLALPFLLVALIPSVRTRLPKPGPWMNGFRRALAVPMALAALAALWLLFRQVGERGLFVGLTASVALATLLFGFGYGQRRGARIGWTILSLCLILGGLAAWQVPSASRASLTNAGAEAWSDARAAQYLARGNKVFVYFTADWCLSCKVNEATAIDRDGVRDAFNKGGVKMLAGDWTNGDPAITRFLEAHGRAGVPYYLWYAPGRPPEELPQILTPAMLISRARAPH